MLNQIKDYLVEAALQPARKLGTASTIAWEVFVEMGDNQSLDPEVIPPRFFGDSGNMNFGGPTESSTIPGDLNTYVGPNRAFEIQPDVIGACLTRSNHPSGTRQRTSFQDRVKLWVG